MLPLVLGLAAWLAVPVAAMAEKLPDYKSAAGMLKIGKDPERPDAEIFRVAYTLTLLPTQAAVAAHRGLSTIQNDPAGFKTAEDYALTGFLTGLATLGRMSTEEQTAFYAKVGGMIGIDSALVALNRGRIGEAVFCNNLLAAQGKVLDLYDGTQASDNPKPEIRDELSVSPDL